PVPGWRDRRPGLRGHRFTPMPRTGEGRDTYRRRTRRLAAGAARRGRGTRPGNAPAADPRPLRGEAVSRVGETGASGGRWTREGPATAPAATTDLDGGAYGRHRPAKEELTRSWSRSGVATGSESSVVAS